MADSHYPMSDDDLPRTIRREREARDAAAYATARSQSTFGPAGEPEGDFTLAEDPRTAVVTRFKVPFVHLMFFFIKCVFAAIPALILLTAVLWGFGQVLKVLYPSLLHFQIQIVPYK